jgi:hypothetical protein
VFSCVFIDPQIVNHIGLDFPGGSLKAEGLGDGLTHGKAAIAKLRLTLPPAMSDDFALTVGEFLFDLVMRDPFSLIQLAQALVHVSNEADPPLNIFPGHAVGELLNCSQRYLFGSHDGIVQSGQRIPQ